MLRDEIAFDWTLTPWLYTGDEHQLNSDSDEGLFHDDDDDELDVLQQEEDEEYRDVVID